MVEGPGAKIGDVTGSVLHIQDDGTYPEFDLQDTLELDTYFRVLDHLVIAPDSVVERIAAKPFDQVDYHRNYQCDGCLYNALCMYDSAEREDLSLVPHLSATEKRMLKLNGINTIQQLADLMVLPLQGTGRELKVARDQQAKVREIKKSPQLALKLPHIVQRAKRAVRRFNSQQESFTYLLGSGWGTLPSEEAYPDLVKIFFDAQHDYLRDRLYMVSALVKGPRGEVAVTELLDAPPTLERERELLSKWIKGVLSAILSVTTDSSAPVHLYCYNPYDQRTLLAALKRHIDAVSEVPGFFDLMTQHPSPEQPIISFLSSELQERRNLGRVCAPLHVASRQFGFTWEHDGEEYFRIFRARVFDNSRYVVRLPNGDLRPANENDPKGPNRLTIESASRFNSQVPLEYAYATWGMLPDVKEDSATLKPFRQVTRSQSVGFATHRVRALAHIEASFTSKSRYIEKLRLDLHSITRLAAPTGNLARSLQEFLFMEHHASLQEKLATYAIPIDQRVQTGLAMLMRCKRFWKSGKEVFAEFEAAFQDLGLDRELTMNTLRLKVGSWVVLNEHDSLQPKSASQIQHGRLAVVKSVEGTFGSVCTTSMQTRRCGRVAWGRLRSKCAATLRDSRILATAFARRFPTCCCLAGIN